MILFPNGIEISETEQLVLENDLVDIEQWVREALTGKINNCKKRMLIAAVPKLIADPKIESIPANEADIIILVTSDPEYKNRSQREDDESLRNQE